MLSHIVKIRLNDETLLKCKTAARRHNMPVSTYIRTTLEHEIGSINEIISLNGCIAALRLDLNNREQNERTSESEKSETTPDQNALLTELVLLLRGVARPEHVNMVHAEMRRQGLDVFSIMN